MFIVKHALMRFPGNFPFLKFYFILGKVKVVKFAFPSAAATKITALKTDS
jgi:hypothetical protein